MFHKFGSGVQWKQWMSKCISSTSFLCWSKLKNPRKRLQKAGVILKIVMEKAYDCGVGLFSIICFTNSGFRVQRRQCMRKCFLPRKKMVNGSLTCLFRVSRKARGPFIPIPLHHCSGGIECFASKSYRYWNDQGF